ncbi:ATP-binding cassette domain-containing protein [Herbiconiux sp. CPCC 203407]|uniref:ATP-binding cassette domain-containing protein n=1 Tax=Herbiconiux oxytropis TaxID=2970915 RepID=A0AA42BTM4_9MICO|nr:ABC transporter ATP-binding protein [Herbiconiux oxytropis]MCS5723097.1 ATP-binding cassette domain-containing protein [Herbiconiux oxytropis]MCS5725346.1 ATP-binding cassette domain-containing protein [Herbiconiux oxytropis]
MRTTDLTKRFGRSTVVDGIDLAVPRGSVFGFLGPNGSGKTTTIRMLLGLASASAGEVRVLEREMPANLARVLPAVGALIEGPGFYPFLSGRANLHRLDSADGFASASTRQARVERALERVGLSSAAGKKVRAYSLGMKQRLGIANALLTPRELIVLDEPTNGLDPQGTREVRTLIRSLAAEGTTVFVSSHLLSEIEQMCSHVAVMRAGRLVAQGALDDLRGAGRTHLRLTVATPDAPTAVATLSRLGVPPAPLGESHPASHPADRPAVRPANDSAIGPAIDPAADAAESTALEGELPETVPAETVVAALVADGVRVRGFAVERASLEDLFVELTGEGFDVVQ